MLGPNDIEDWLNSAHEDAIAALLDNPLIRDVCDPCTEAGQLASVSLRALAATLIDGKELDQPQIDLLSEGLNDLEYHLAPQAMKH